MSILGNDVFLMHFKKSVRLYSAMGKALGYRSGGQGLSPAREHISYALLINNPNKLNQLSWLLVY